MYFFILLEANSCENLGVDIIKSGLVGVFNIQFLIKS